MSLELLEICTGGAAVGVLLHIMSRIGGKSKKISLPEDEKLCTGYRFGRGVVCVMRDDCTALRSPDCKDGRCTYHCEEMCKCITALGLR